MRKCGCKSGIYMTTKLTVASPSEKIRVIILQVVLQQNKQRKIEKRFYNLQFYELQLKTNTPFICTANLKAMLTALQNHENPHFNCSKKSIV